LKLDVRTKLFFAAIFSTLALAYQNPLILALLLAMNILLLLWLRAPLYLFWGIRKFIVLYLILIVIQSLFVKSGAPLLSIGSFSLVTTGGVVYGFSIVLRFLVLIGSGLIILNCNTGELLLALVKMRVPYEIVFMIQLGIRFIPVLIAEMGNIFTAIQLRGVDLRKVYKRKVVRVYTGIFMPLLYGILQKAEQLSILLELRGFRRMPDRTYYRSISMGRLDYGIILVSALLTVFFMLGAVKLQSWSMGFLP